MARRGLAFGWLLLACWTLTACLGETGAEEGGGALACESASDCLSLCFCAGGSAEACSAACAPATGGASGGGGTPVGGGTGGVGGAASGGSGSNSGGAPSSTGGASGGCADDGSGWQSEWQAFECEVLALVNQRRAQGASCGGANMAPVGPLQRNTALTSSARGHAEDMATKNYFAHQSLDGKSPFDRMQAAGYSGSTMGENIAAGQATPAQVMQSWMQSPGHCKNIMTAGFHDLGVGYFRVSGGLAHYWVQNFGG